jgi:hypothetical protein
MRRNRKKQHLPLKCPAIPMLGQGSYIEVRILVPQLFFSAILPASSGQLTYKRGQHLGNTGLGSSRHFGIGR